MIVNLLFTVPAKNLGDEKKICITIYLGRMDLGFFVNRFSS